MAEHAELIAELPMVEKMTTQDRLKHAKKQRSHQLKVWSQREKEYNSKRNKFIQNQKSKRSDYKIHFDPSVMLLEAAARNDVEEVEKLLLLSVDPDSTNEDGLTALHQCCIDNSEELIKLLIEFGANVNAEDSEKWTPLHAAATCGHLNLARLLINKGANLLAVNADGNMPYDICEDEKTLDYIESEMAKRGITQQLIDDTRIATEMQMLHDLKWVVENDHDLDAVDNQGATYLHIAAANGYISVVNFLLENGASPNIQDNDSWQPIHSAACWGHPDILDILFQYGADINAETRSGETPYDICEDPELKERIQQLQNELEIRRLAQQTTRLRRSQSQNTRSHSVRRTSLRDKSQISWKEAREEAKIRMDKQEKIKDPNFQKISAVSVMNGDSEAVSIDDVMIMLSNGDTGEQLTKTMPHSDKLVNDKLKSGYPLEEKKEMLTNSHAYDEDRKPNENTFESANCDKPQKSNSVKGSHSHHYGQGDGPSNNPLTESSSSSNNNNNNNNNNNGNSARALAVSQSDLKVDLNIHVTVNGVPPYNSNVGTLADLKRHRSDVRNRTNSIISTTSVEPLPSDDEVKNKSVNNNAFQSLSSPSINRRKFYDHSEIIGPPQKHGCCKLM